MLYIASSSIKSTVSGPLRRWIKSSPGKQRTEAYKPSCSYSKTRYTGGECHYTDIEWTDGDVVLV